MFIGHFALGFAAKRLAPSQNLAVLMVAPLLADIVFPVLILMGVERAHVEPGVTAFFPIALDSMPWSHSFLMHFVWAALYAGVVLAVTRDRRGAAWCAALVVSHWVLDVVTHRPDVQWVPWSEARAGLGLWNSVAGTLAVELAMFAGAVLVYFRATRARDGVGRVVPWVFVGLVLASYFGSAFGPPPPSAEAMAGALLGSLVLVAVVAWFDSRRAVVTSVGPHPGPHPGPLPELEGKLGPLP